jgi:hypothetical protein
MTSVWPANPVVGDPHSVEKISLSKSEIKLPTRATSPMIDAAAGGISGMVGVFAGSPFDVVKTRMQNSHVSVSALTVLSKTFQREGLTAFWKGVTPPLIAEGFLNHIWFGVYAYTASIMRPDPRMELPFYQAFIAGGFAGMVGAILVAPSDLIKLQSQVNEGVGKDRKTPMDIIKEIYQREGRKGFTRGFTAALLRDTPGLGMFFGVYNLVKNMFRREDGSISGFGQIVAGGTSGIGSWIISYPFDVIKTRMQVSSEYSGLWHCARDAYRMEGHRVFFRGMAPCLVGAFPINAIIFFIYELLIQASWRLDEQNSSSG